MRGPQLAYDADAEPLDAEDGAVAAPSADVMALEVIAASDINLAEHLETKACADIVSRCLDGYERDVSSRADWVEGFDRGMELVRLARTTGDRTLAFSRAADVRYPLLATACIQFNARAYPAIINGPQIVKTQVEGDDPNGEKAARGQRVSEHMSWQLLSDMPEWEGDTDKLLLHLPAAGMAFRQYTWDKVNGRPKTEFISAKRFVINQEASDLKTAPLFTVEFDVYAYQITEAQRSGRWRDVAVALKDDQKRDKEDMLRCHVRFDLDEDGYDEPYIAIIHKESNTLLSLRPDFWPQDVVRDEQGQVVKVDRRCLIVPYGFIPDPEGKFYWLGFGQLLLSHNEVIDALINQLIDAGTLQNLGGGFAGRGASLPGGRLEFEPGEWKAINVPGNDLKANLVPIPTPAPSATTFQMLQMMIQSGKDLTSISDALTGSAPPNQPATTTLSNVEQATMVITAINKRVFRAVGEECEVLYALNGAFLPDQAYYRFADDQRAIAREDYAAGDMDVKPIADPSMASAPQRMAQVQFLREYTNGNPRFDPAKVDERVMTLARIPDWKALLAPPAQANPLDALKAEGLATQVAKGHAEVERMKVETDGKHADVLLTNAQAADQLADAETKHLANEITRRALAGEDAGAAAGAAAAENLDAFEQALASGGSLGGVALSPPDDPGAQGAPPTSAGPQGPGSGLGMGAGMPAGPGTEGPQPGAGGPLADQSQQPPSDGV